MVGRRKPTTEAVATLHRRYFESRPLRLAELDEERSNAEIARKIYDLRKRAGLTQAQLAGLVGTTASVVSRDNSSFLARRGDSRVFA